MEKLTEEVISKIEEGMKINVSNVSPEELLIKDENGITLLDHLFKKNVQILGIKNIIKKSPEIVYIYIKNNESIFLYDISEEILFSTVEGKKIIEYIVEKDMPDIMSLTRKIENHVEIIDYFIKMNQPLLFFNDKLINKLSTKQEDGTYLFKKYINNKDIMRSYISSLDDKKIIMELIKIGEPELITLFTDKHLLMKLFNNKTVIEYLIEKNYDIKKLHIKNIETIKLLYKKNKLHEIGITVEEELLFYPIEENNQYTYFDYLLDNHKAIMLRLQKRLIYRSKEMKAKYYITLARHNLMPYAIELTEDDLIDNKSMPSIFRKQTDKKESLLEILLNLDKELTVNKILSPWQKSNPKIAAILKARGINQTRVNLGMQDGVFNEYVNDYIAENNNKIGIGPLLKEDEELLNRLSQIFLSDGKSDPELISVLVSGYRQSLFVDRQTNIIEIEKLIEIKQNNPQFYYLKSENNSYFNKADESIFIDRPYTSTILHETGHALHHFLNDSSIPDNYKEIIDSARSNQNLAISKEKLKFYYKKRNKDLIKQTRIIFGKLLDDYYSEEKITQIILNLSKTKEEKMEEFKELGIPDEQLDVILNDMFSPPKYIETQWQIFSKEFRNAKFDQTEPLFCEISDIIDAIYKGEVHDIDSLPGHGINYYSFPFNGFNEMIANFSSISKFGYSNNLKEIVGEEVYDMISNYYYQNILGIPSKNIRR